ncbi:MAG: hypothetical protein K2X86_01190 [Cytophagaceae bacterium]|nr:hypothetical protein [Cytophagaceae bacterium]
MRNIIALLLLLCNASCFAGSPSLSEVRTLYEKAATEEASCVKLIELLASCGEKEYLLCGYKAGATMMMANYVTNPFSKLSYFNTGKDMLEKAITSDDKNVELRFLRFGVQSNAPSFLGYIDHLETDKKFLLETVQTLTDLDLKKNIISFLKKSDRLNALEKQKLE